MNEDKALRFLPRAKTEPLLTRRLQMAPFSLDSGPAGARPVSTYNRVTPEG